MNGCEGMTDSIFERLHSPEGHGPPHALEVLSAKGCKNLRAFWLGVPPLQQSDARLPPSCQEGQHFPLALSEPATASLANPLSGEPLPPDHMPERRSGCAHTRVGFSTRQLEVVRSTCHV